MDDQLIDSFTNEYHGTLVQVELWRDASWLYRIDSPEGQMEFDTLSEAIAECKRRKREPTERREVTLDEALGPSEMIEESLRLNEELKRLEDDARRSAGED